MARFPYSHTPKLPYLAALLLPSLAPARAQTSYPMLTNVYPAGLQRRTTAEITVGGTGNFAGAYRVLFEGSGLSAEVVPPAPPKPGEKQPATRDSVTLKVTAAADAALGAHEIRVLTPRGASSIGQVVVSDEPERNEKEPNNTVEQAEPITLPVTINGRIQAEEDVDRYRFHAEAGQEVVFSVLSARLQDKIHDLMPGSGGDHVDPMLTLSDSEGRELDSNDDVYGADPLLAHRFEKAGDYIISIRDVRYAGHPTYVYRLTVTRRPFLTALYPMAGRRGTSVPVEPVGFNLNGTTKAAVDVSAGQAETPMDVQLRVGDQTTNAVPFLATDLPEALEQEPNDTPNHATRVELPGGWNGRIDKPGDVDLFRFAAKKGTAYTFEVQARRYRSALDSVIRLMDGSGRPLASNDDAIGKDSRIDWTAPADGEYLLQIADLQGRGGPTFVYHIAATASRPDFSLQCDDDKALIGPGSGYAMYVIANRRYGFAGEIKLSVEGLPPGVTASADRIPANMTQGCIIFRAAPDAKIDAANIRILGTAAVKQPDGSTQTLQHVAEPLQEVYTPGGGRARYPVDLHTVSVTEPSDVLVKVSATEVKLAPGGSATVDVEITRQKGYKGPVTLDVMIRHLGTVYANPLPPGFTLDEGASKTLLGPEDSKGKIVLKCAPDAPALEKLPLAILGQVSINFVAKVSHASEPILLSVGK